MMRPARVVSAALPALAFGAAGCAAIIGASFGDATLASDGGPDAVVFSDAGGFDGSVVDPGKLAGLGLWLDATEQLEVSGTSVTRWHDLSGKGRDAVPIGDPTQAPTVASAINAITSVHFEAISSQLLVTPWIGPNGDVLTIFLVTSGSPQSAIRFQSDVNQPPSVIFPFDVNALTGGFADFGFAVTGAPLVRVGIRASPPLVLTARFDHGAMTTYVNGQLSEQHLPTITSLPTGQTLYIGGGMPLLDPPDTASQFFDGDLGEVLIYEASLSDPDRSAVEVYLREKWGI